ncbi:MAG: methionine adenosyltransferase [Clostridia bacterium]|nr:methionine adenosyltransferase [Clostridia bacterium]
MKRLFTSESVTEGHPDKICDQLSDAVLDAILTEDKTARVACETMASTGTIVVVGEVTTSAYVDIQSIVRKTVVDIGYDRAKYGFDGHTCGILTSIHEQSPDIAMGVDKAKEQRDGDADRYSETGAGDQGMMFGYACNETPTYMPMTAYYAHRLCMKLAETRKNGQCAWMRPDGKSQVTVEYDEQDKPVRIDTVLISTQHSPDVTQEFIRQEIIDKVINQVIPAELMDADTRILVNPTGQFVQGGPGADSGLTGRKIIVDTYGGCGRHGGGAFSGKDPTKVDRSAAYAARHAAKNIVAAGLASKCEIQLAYAIGVAKPVSIRVDTFGTGVRSDEDIADMVAQLFDMRPAAIIDRLDLRRPIYKKTAAYGHFGREDADFTWEYLDMVDSIKQYFNI